jgi:plasmid stabilization system protein ParE
MRELVWLDSAVNDLQRLHDFLLTKSPDAAQRAVKVIREATVQLLSLPNIGKPDQDLPDFRDLHIRFGTAGYVLRYRVQTDIIYVVHLRHYRETNFSV